MSKQIKPQTQNVDVNKGRHVAPLRQSSGSNKPSPSGNSTTKPSKGNK